MLNNNYTFPSHVVTCDFTQVTVYLGSGSHGIHVIYLFIFIYLNQYLYRSIQFKIASLNWGCVQHPGLHFELTFAALPTRKSPLMQLAVNVISNNL